MRFFVNIIDLCSLVILFSIGSCTSNQLPKGVAVAINNSGDNKKELLGVLDHYSCREKDSLKLKAAYFLIEHMDGRYYFDGELLRKYQQYPKLIILDGEHGEYIMNSFNKIFGDFSYDKVEMVFDNQSISCGDLISNIDMAFKVWDEEPWGKHYNFDQFCEYILPFRISNEKPEYNRELIYNKYHSILDSISAIGGDAVEACRVLNRYLGATQWLFTTRTSFLPHYPSSILLESRSGTCREMSDLSIFVMRAAGIPVGSDFLPQWPNRGSSHNWNVVLDKYGKFIMFMGTEDDPGITHKAGTKKGKIYRNTFVVNRESLAAVKDSSDFVPGFLNDSRIRDVTDQYVRTFDVEVYPEPLFSQDKYIYLAVFNNVEWIPIGWAVNKSKVRFNMFEGGIVYLPGYYTPNGFLPAQVPFVLTDLGKVRYLRPNYEKRIKQLKCLKVFPDLPEDIGVNDFKGGRFQGSNDKDFRNVEDLCTVSGKVLPYLNEVIPKKNTKKYRYVRYMASPRNDCHLGDMEFRSMGVKVKGYPFSLTGSFNSDVNLHNAIDGNPLTSISSNRRAAWIALDFGKPILIDKIRFVPKLNVRQETLIEDEKEYEIKCWTKGQWEVVGKAKGLDGSVIFNNIPSGGLYILSESSNTVKSRIFTYENGRQRWW